MTDQNLTEIICVVDRSGSMASIRDDAIGGFNSFVEELGQFLWPEEIKRARRRSSGG